MRREKQIEEMAKDLCQNEFCSTECHARCRLSANSYCWDVEIIAEKLYNAGYRKQSEGEWIDRYNNDFANPIYMCSVCGKGTLLKPHINELNNMEMTQALSPYCPNCGAKMSKGERK